MMHGTHNVKLGPVMFCARSLVGSVYWCKRPFGLNILLDSWLDFWNRVLEKLRVVHVLATISFSNGTLMFIIIFSHTKPQAVPVLNQKTPVHFTLNQFLCSILILHFKLRPVLQNAFFRFPRYNFVCISCLSLCLSILTPSHSL